jgi:hypothetical protein
LPAPASPPAPESVAPVANEPAGNEPAAVDAAPVESFMDESQLREFQEQRDAQEFTAGFFAALLDAQSVEAEPPASTGTAPMAEGSVVDDDRQPPADTADDSGRTPWGSTAAADLEPAGRVAESSPKSGEPSEPAEEDRPPEVTMAEEDLDVRPDEREYLDDLMELDGELASDVHADEAAAAAGGALPELGAMPDVDEGEPEEGAVDARAEAAEPPADEPAVDLPPMDESPVTEPTSGGATDDEFSPSLAGPDDEVVVPHDEVVAAHEEIVAPDDEVEGRDAEIVVPHDELVVAHDDIAVPHDEIAVRYDEQSAPDEAFSAEESLSADDEAPPLSFVTATMGTLLLQQGFRDDALQIFRQLAAQNPDDADMRARVEELEAELAPRADAGGGMTVAGWLRSLAGARPSVPPESTAPAAPVGPASGAAEAIDTDFTGSAEWVEARPEPEAAPDIADGVDRIEAGGEAAPPAAAEWVEATPEGMTSEEMTSAGMTPEEMTSADSVMAVVDGMDSPAPSGLTGVEATADEAAPAAPAETDLLAGAAAAAASAVTWEAPESPAASDELFFGDDPLDWGQEPPAPVTEPAAPVSLEELLGRPVSADDELAAGALAAATLAMQGDAGVDAALAEASAEDPLALQNVLSPTPTGLAALRGGASFSFEQFFHPESAASESGEAAGAGPVAPQSTPSGSAAPEPTSQSAAGATGGSPPPAGADDEAAARDADLADFHAWLAGLSKS